MQVEEKFLIVRYSGITIRPTETVGLRGFFADLDFEAEAIHNHRTDGAVIYRYPQVQYKTLKRNPVIIAFGKGISSVYPLVMEHTDLSINGNTYSSPEMHIELTKKKIGDSREQKTYKLISPWIGLNQMNYKKYMLLEEEQEKVSLLNRILVGNILSLCKGFDVTIENQLTVESKLMPVHVHYKGEHMIGFKGTFTVNAELPTMCGIGKGVALGYGTIIKQKKREGIDAGTDICGENSGNRQADE